MNRKSALRRTALAVAVVLSVPVFAQVTDSPTPATKVGIEFLDPPMSKPIGSAHVAAVSLAFKKFGQEDREANSEKIAR